MDSAKPFLISHKLNGRVKLSADYFSIISASVGLNNWGVGSVHNSV